MGNYYPIAIKLPNLKLKMINKTQYFSFSVFILSYTLLVSCLFLDFLSLKIDKSYPSKNNTIHNMGKI